MAVLTTTDDDQLVSLAADGDTAALATLLDRHLHPAWRIALAASPSPAAAEAAVTTGMCDGLNAAARNPDPAVSIRTRIAAAVHAACLAADRDGRRSTPVVHADPVVAAFATLPVASRTALWLTEVEGGEAAQIAPVLGLDRNATAALADRAVTTLRDRLATDAAGKAANPECARALGKLPAHAAGRLTAEERGRIGEHLAGCGDCAVWVAAVVAPRPALRRIVVPIPDALPGAIAARWAEAGGRDRSPFVLRAFHDRAVGAAAAAVIALGLAGAVVFGRGSGGDGPELATPAGAVDLSGDDDATPAVSFPAAALPAGTPVMRSASGFGGGTGGGGGGTTAVLGTPDRPRASDPTPRATPPPTTTPTTTTPTTAPPSSSTPPASSDPDGPLPALPIPTPTTIPLPIPTDPSGEDSGGDTGGDTVDLGILQVETGDDPQVIVEIPGLPPVELLP